MSGILFQNGQRKYLTREEREAFLKAAEKTDREVRTFCGVLAYTGCRISEALALTAERIDLTAGELPINRSHWIPEEMELLEKLLNSEATQLKIAAALPYRSWQKIRKQITQLRDKTFKVLKVGQMEVNETFMDYLRRNPDFLSTSTTSFLAEGNLAPRSPN